MLHRDHDPDMVSMGFYVKCRPSHDGCSAQGPIANDADSATRRWNRNKQCLREAHRQGELIHELAGVLWRLEKYGYIGNEVDDDERGQCDHWREIGRLAVEVARKERMV